jgi:hypothetical protein
MADCRDLLADRCIWRVPPVSRAGLSQAIWQSTYYGEQRR